MSLHSSHSLTRITRRPPKRRRRWVLTAAAAAPLLTLGLAAAPDASADNSFPRAYAGRQSEQSPARTYVNAYNGGAQDADVTMEPTDGWVCFLTGVQGRLNTYGGGEHRASYAVVHHAPASWLREIEENDSDVSVADLDTGDRWKLAAFNHGGTLQVAAGATCVPTSRFATDPGGVVWISPMTDKKGRFLKEQFKYDFEATCGTSTVGRDLWQGDASSYISGLMPQFLHPEDSVDITTQGPGDPARLNVSSNSCWAYSDAAAYSLFVGVPQTGQWMNLSGRGIVDLHAGPGRGHRVPIAPTGESACFFTGLGGRFRGPGESAWIYPDTIGGVEYWTAEVAAGAEGDVHARVKCISYDQTHPPVGVS